MTPACDETLIMATEEKVNGWMDGWMDEWMDGWLDGWINGWTNCQKITKKVRKSIKFQNDSKEPAREDLEGFGAARALQSQKEMILKLGSVVKGLFWG